jgi:hypothetical protein
MAVDLDFAANVLRDLCNTPEELQSFAQRCLVLGDECERDATVADSDGFAQIHQAAANNWRALAAKLSNLATQTMSR